MQRYDEWPDRELTADELYDKHKPFLNGVCKFYHTKYGGEWDEWVSRANLCFAEAAAGFDPGCLNKFITYLYYKVHGGLANYIRQEAKKGERLKRERNFHLESVPQPEGVEQEELSEDAQFVKQLAVDFPGFKKIPTQKRKGIITEFLLEIGWAMRRVLETFSEIREIIGK